MSDTDIRSEEFRNLAPSIPAAIRTPDFGQVENFDLEHLKRAAHLILGQTKENVARTDLLRTPDRFARAYQSFFSGYHREPAEVVGTGIFPAESQSVVSVNRIVFYSLCEHHLLPFWGEAAVAYIPKKKILGLSKIPRLVELFARRVQVQERLTRQIGESLVELIDPTAIAVRIKAQHLCVMMRGVEKEHSSTVTEQFFDAESLTSLQQDSLVTAVRSE